jgi:tetratricopeptide (TPR) repeat protein
MDWITVLRSLQSDFINRISSGSLLHCQTEGQHSELSIISGGRLNYLRNFCWQMAEKYKRVSPVRDVFTSFLKGKLGEEVVKERLAGFITEVDYEKRIGGDGNVDFTLSSNPLIGIEVKSRCGGIDVKWSVTAEEVAKNAVIVCILIQEKVNEAQAEYHLILAGFLPTKMIKLKTGRITFGIDQLLYGGGLLTYLQQFNSSSINNYHRDKIAIYQYISPARTNHDLNHHQSDKYEYEEDDLRHSPEELIQLYIQTGNESFERGNYETAIISYQGALKLSNNLNYPTTEIYYKIAIAKYQFGDYEGTIRDCLQIININPHHLKAYQRSGLARFQICDREGAIEDFSQAIRINPNDSFAYINRAYARSQLGDKQGAIEDYTQAIKLNPNFHKFNNDNLDNGSFQNNLTKNNLTKNNLTNNHEIFQALLQITDQTEEITPDSTESYKKRAIYRYETGDYEGAISDYTEALKTNTHDTESYFNRANARYEIGDKKGAIEDFSQVIKINPTDADSYLYRGNFRLELGDKQGTIEDFKKAVDLYHKQGNISEYRKTRELILDLEIEESLDVLNF